MEIWEEIKADPNSGAKRLVVEYGDRLYDAAVRLCLDYKEKGLTPLVE